MIEPKLAKAKLKHRRRHTDGLPTAQADWTDHYFASAREALLMAKAMLTSSDREPVAVYVGPFTDIGLTRGGDQRLWYRLDHSPENLDALLREHADGLESQTPTPRYESWGEF